MRRKQEVVDVYLIHSDELHKSVHFVDWSDSVNFVIPSSARLCASLKGKQNADESDELRVHNAEK